MLGPFFAVAARSPGRRRSLQLAMFLHLGMCLAIVFLTHHPQTPLVLGMTLLLAGIVEGAILIGWRLTQIPRSQALEFLLVSPVSPRLVYFAEMLVGLLRLAIVQLTALPVLVVLAEIRKILWWDVPVLLLVPWTWGAVTGLGLTAWAYESAPLRRVGERVVGVVIIVYLIVGVLAAERLPRWLEALPAATGQWILFALLLMRDYNPFTLTASWFMLPPTRTLQPMLALELAAIVFLGLIVARSAFRLKGHFQDRHYGPRQPGKSRTREAIGDRPLTWWAVKRVMEYAGRVNLYLAGGFGIVYAVYLVAGTSWPTWLGRETFRVIEVGMAGLPGLSTALVVLAAVPAAFQYGLWDSSVTDRCRRLELLLLTNLDATDYLLAALAAAWRRGRGYLAVAFILWGAGLYAGHLTIAQALAGFASASVLWTLYYAVGYWSFSRGWQANGLGSLLTLGLPLLTGLAHLTVGPAAVFALPPGLVYGSLTIGPSLIWGFALTCYLALTVWLLGYTHRRADQWLRAWFNHNQGRKTQD